MLAEGAVVAVKGIGGYHLACDAGNEAAVRALRVRKQRGDKPFAVMVADLDDRAGAGRIDAAEAALLEGPRGPSCCSPGAPTPGRERSAHRGVRRPG